MICKFRTKKSPHIFEQKSFRGNFAYCTDGLRPHVSGIFFASVQPTYGKRLTGRTASYELHKILKYSPVDRADVLGMDLPMANMFYAATDIVLDILDRVSVSFDKQQVLKSRLGKPQGKTSASTKQLDTTHRFFP